MLISQKKDVVENEMKERTNIFQKDKLEFIKNPTVLEFLGLPWNQSYLEKDLEKALEYAQKAYTELNNQN